MNKFKHLLVLAAAIMIGFTACKKDENETNQDNTKEQTVAKALIVNYGTYKLSNGEISIYDEAAKTITNKAYEKANDLAYSSCIQSMAIHNGKAYLMANNGDKIDVLDASTLAAAGTPIVDITKPRYFTAEGNTGYISCWGPVEDWSNVKDSYVAVVDLSTNTITNTIAIPNGPEGIIYHNNKLYVALAFARQIAVVDLSSNAVSYIDTKAVPMHLVKDNSNQIWATVVSTYSNPSGADSVGLAIINTTTDEVSSYVNFEGISGGGQILINNDKSSIYVMGKEAWPGTLSTVYQINTANKTIASSALISGENFNGIGYNPTTDNIYVMISPSTDVNGTIQIYSAEGNLIDEAETSIAPLHVVFN